MKQIIFLISLFFLVNCTITKNNIIGDYGFDGENTLDSIIINKDNTYIHKVYNNENKLMYSGKSKWEMEKNNRITFFDFYTNEDYNLTEYLTEKQAKKFLMIASYPLYRKNKQIIIVANYNENIIYFKK